MNKTCDRDNGAATGKVSVITVCYNEAPERVHYTLPSIIAQEYDDMELVVVDGGSSQDTLAALSRYSAAISHLVSEPDEGLYDAMNKGLKMATGEWVMFLNIGDSFHSKSALSSMSQYISNHGAVDMLYGDIVVRDAYSKSKIKRFPRKLSRFFLYRSMICHQSILARRNVFEIIGDFNTSYRLLADKDWLLRFLEAGHTCRHAGSIICTWEAGGLSYDEKLSRKERSSIHRAHYSRFDRMTYALGWFFLIIYNRIRNQNFSLPAFFRITCANYCSKKIYSWKLIWKLMAKTKSKH